MALCNQPEAFTLDLGDDQSRYFLDMCWVRLVSYHTQELHTACKSLSGEPTSPAGLQKLGRITQMSQRNVAVLCALQDGQTFLMIACQLGNYHMVQRLLDEPSVDVNAVDNVSTFVYV